jgi:hypothetical protein
MKQHPYRHPRRAIAMNGGNDNDRDADYEFESKLIDDYDLWMRKLVWGNGEMLDGGGHRVKSQSPFRKRTCRPRRGVRQVPFLNRRLTTLSRLLKQLKTPFV